MTVARRRGFFAEMQHQAKLAEQRQQAALRQQAQAARRTEVAQRAAERARLAAERASEQDRKRLEREAAQAYAAARVAEAEDATAELQARFRELDGILSATLDVDDFVDLATLRVVVQHPPFPEMGLRVPVRAPAPIPAPSLPVKQEPEPVKGLFGRKQKQEQAVAAVEEKYAADYWAWKAESDALPARRAEQAEAHARAEAERAQKLAAAEARYAEESSAREREVAEQNEALDQLIAGLGYGTVDAVQEYVSIVLANSVYPEWLQVSHSAEFEPSQAELTVRVLVPGPEIVPAVKHFKYTKASDEITPVAATQKDTKDRYAALVHNVALRSMHEIFEADRRALIQSVSLELGTETISPATGQPVYVPLVAVAVRREEFEKIDLSAVVPAATLEHLGAAVSKNPHALTPIATAGVRRAR
ncbi:hypothetical protein ACIPV2_04570 [Microbacterium sp. NPDC089987]|uniref:hypothetical protein n=1 Tax=Microbacterium sp. NPDC089987 TaxID=3364202 RepID=UPI00380651E6